MTLAKLLLTNQEFRSHVSGPAKELSLPSILQLVRSRQGLQGLLEYYEGAEPPEVWSSPPHPLWFPTGVKQPSSLPLLHRALACSRYGR